MNALLFLPPFLVLLVGHERVSTACAALGAFVGVQVVVGWPFLSTYPREYLGRAFELGRKFTYAWTVNWKFVSMETFASDAFSSGLLFAHVAVLFAFAHARWHRKGGGFFPAFFVDFFERARTDAPAAKRLKALTPADVFSAMAEGNFIGIVFARSLHYQFYAWYFHSLPALLWSVGGARGRSRRGETASHTGGGMDGGFRRRRKAFAVVVARVGAMGAIEWCWNAYPSTPTSSLVLFATHAALLLSLWLGGVGVRSTSGGRRRSRGGGGRARSKKKLR
jgi:alpha-1,3-mannosyltransferase